MSFFVSLLPAAHITFVLPNEQEHKQSNEQTNRLTSGGKNMSNNSCCILVRAKHAFHNIAKIYALRSAVVHKILRLIWNDSHNHSGIMQMLSFVAATSTSTPVTDDNHCIQCCHTVNVLSSKWRKVGMRMRMWQRRQQRWCWWQNFCCRNLFYMLKELLSTHMHSYALLRFLGLMVLATCSFTLASHLFFTFIIVLLSAVPFGMVLFRVLFSIKTSRT